MAIARLMWTQSGQTALSAVPGHEKQQQDVRIAGLRTRYSQPNPTPDTSRIARSIAARTPTRVQRFRASGAP